MASPPHAMSPPAMSPSAMSPPAMSPPSMSPRAMSPRAMSPRAMSPRAMSPRAMSPSAMSPPNPPPAQLPSKKRASPLDVNAPPMKRRKPSSLSQSSAPAHPLRQTSFPPEGRSPYARSPSADGASAVSGSAVSGVTAGGASKKKRGRKSKSAGAQAVDSAEQTPSVVGATTATVVSGQGGDKEGDEEEEDEKEEMALEDVVARTQEQKQEEIRLRAMLVEAFDDEQYSRYELWRAAKLSESVVKRVVNATVSQSVPPMVSTAVKAVTKLFAGEIIEGARRVQGEWLAAGEKQAELPPPETDTAAEARRGPLRPDHLREAWRRYRISGESRGVGMQQLWHAQQGDGVERFATRTRKRLFR